MKNGICFIVSAGEASPRFLPRRREGDLLIAADAGYNILREAGIEPDAFVGDADSLGFVPGIPDKTALPCEKDDTDTEAAIKLGFERGYSRFVIFGALGGKRFSHSLANLHCLAYVSERGGEGVIADERCTVRYLTAGTEHGFCASDGYFSLLPACPGAVVTIRGAKYPLSKERIPFSSTLGVSNEPRGDCSVTVHEGAVFFVREPGETDFFD